MSHFFLPQILLIGWGLLILITGGVRLSNNKNLTKPYSIYLAMMLIFYGMFPFLPPFSFLFKKIIYFLPFYLSLVIVSFLLIKKGAKNIKEDEFVNEKINSKSKKFFIFIILVIFILIYIQFSFLPLMKQIKERACHRIALEKAIEHWQREAGSYVVAWRPDDYEIYKKDCLEKRFFYVISLINNKKEAAETGEIIIDKFDEEKKRLDKISEWKSYKNEKHEFEFDHPIASKIQDNEFLPNEEFEVEIIYPGEEWFEPSRLIISNSPSRHNGEREYEENNLFRESEKIEDIIRIKFVKNGKKIYASCVDYKNINIVDFCNEIISTFRFLD